MYCNGQYCVALDCIVMDCIVLVLHEEVRKGAAL